MGASGPLPLLITHTQLRKFKPMERALGEREIRYILEHDGIIGLIPSQFMLEKAWTDAQVETDAPSAAKGLTCISSLDLFESAVESAIQLLKSPKRIALASDINAPLDGLSPGCATDPSILNDPEQLDLHRKGYYRYSQWNELIKRVSPDSIRYLEWNRMNLEHFLSLWEKISLYR